MDKGCCGFNWYLLLGAILGAVGFAVFVNGFALQWNAGGDVRNYMALGYYFVGLVVISLGCMKCCHCFGICEPKKK